MKLPGALLSPSSKNKKIRPENFFLYFLKKNFSYISGNETLLYVLKKVFLIFLEMELSSLKNKKL